MRRCLDTHPTRAQYGPVPFGVCLPGRGPLARPDALIRPAERAEALRFSSLFHQALGVSHFVFDPPPGDLRGQLAKLERFADDVRPKVFSRTRS